MLEELRAVDCLALDCEGVKLGSKDGGKLCLMQLSCRPRASNGSSNSSASALRTWVVDVCALGWRAFHYTTQDKQASARE